MNWNPRIANRARKALERFPAKDRRLLLSALEEMRTDPFSGKIKRLKSERSAFRRRVGNYRIFFDVDLDSFVVDIADIVRRTSTTY